jgi:aryl-alcohol dehydrogenase-like predicted oxidoreductase
VARIPGTELDVSPLCLGTNVFGWTADEQQSFAVLDAFAAAGGNFIDTADAYSRWVPGHAGGESESIIGAWMSSRGCRDEMIVATKAGMLGPLDADGVRDGAAASLRRLQTDRIDLYYAHRDDPEMPLRETLTALDQLVQAGAVRHIAASNYSPQRLGEALAVSDREGLARYVALQPPYNLMDRDVYEGALEALCAREGLGCIPYYGLAKGFLAGKQRLGGADVDSPRAASARAYLQDPRAPAVLEALDTIAAAHSTSVASVALAWLASRPTVVAPIASARTPEQLAELLPFTELKLGEEELTRLSHASAPRS